MKNLKIGDIITYREKYDYCDWVDITGEIIKIDYDYHRFLVKNKCDNRWAQPSQIVIIHKKSDVKDNINKENKEEDMKFVKEMYEEVKSKMDEKDKGNLEKIIEQVMDTCKKFKKRPIATIFLIYLIKIIFKTEVKNKGE